LANNDSLSVRGTSTSTPRVPTTTAHRRLNEPGRFTNCRGDEDIDAKRSRPSIGKPVMGHAKKERVLLFGTDQRITSGPAAKRSHSKAEYMTAPERFAEGRVDED
jgi:hypothetical protein